MNTHDNAYKFLFSHPQAVADLLRGFVREDWVALLDFSSLEKVSGSYVSDDLRDREDDVIWRLRLSNNQDNGPGEWLYLYLLLEFQSTVVSHMAVRIMAYLSLLYQDLISAKVCRGDQLPLVFPLVLYNGRAPWSAALDVAQLIEAGPAGLEAYRPHLRYALIDEGRIPEVELQRAEAEQSHNSVASLLQIERSASPQEVARAVARLTQKLQGPEHDSLRRAFTVWINRLILRRFTPVELPDMQDLPEVNTMIAERIDSWTQQWLKQGMQQGRQQGRQEGRQEAQAQTLKRLLVRRFGTLPETLASSIEQAEPDQLDLWLDRVLDADSLAAVFLAE